MAVLNPTTCIIAVVCASPDLCVECEGRYIPS